MQFLPTGQWSIINLFWYSAISVDDAEHNPLSAAFENRPILQIERKSSLRKSYLVITTL